MVKVNGQNKMKCSSVAAFIAVLVVVLAAPAVLGRPPHRQKRVSDQRLGELEALLALQKLKGKLVTVPIAFGQINPNDYGRKRRSAPPNQQQTLQSLENLQSALLDRILESLPQEDVLALSQSLQFSDSYDEIPAEGQHWAASPYERPSSAFNRPVTE